MLALGLSWALSGIGVFVRDLNHTTAFISTALMYASAILYSLSRVPLSIAQVLKYNPLVTIVDQARKVILWNQSLDIKALCFAYLVSAIILILGYIIFSRLRPYFAELL